MCMKDNEITTRNENNNLKQINKNAKKNLFNKHSQKYLIGWKNYWIFFHSYLVKQIKNLIFFAFIYKNQSWL